MKTLPSKSLTERTYQAIRTDIITCKLLPGSKLKIKDLCEHFDASLGAVREALSRLAAEGFVVAEPQKSYMIAPISLDELEDLTKTRTTIENLCLVRAIESGGLEWEAEIVATFYRLNRVSEKLPEPRWLSEEWSQAHQAFHSSLVAACDSPWLLRIRDMLFDKSDRYRRLSAIATREERDVMAEHKSIMDAVLARNSVAASALMEEHFRKTATASSKGQWSGQSRSVIPAKE